MEPAAFDILIGFLARGDADGGEAYEKARRRLLRYFELKGLIDAPELVDATFDRVARKLGEGVEVHLEPLAYVVGVARFVALENIKHRARQEQAADGERTVADTGELRDKMARERYLEALEHCLDGLVPAERERVMVYYRGRGKPRIEARRRIAEALGVGVNALRIRMHRTRQRLEDCVRGRLGGEL